MLEYCPNLKTIHCESSLTTDLGEPFGLTGKDFCDKFLSETGVEMLRLGH